MFSLQLFPFTLLHFLARSLKALSVVTIFIFPTLIFFFYFIQEKKMTIILTS